MDHVKLISELCGIIDAQNEIIQAQAVELAQCDAVGRAEEIAGLRQKYENAIGVREEVAKA